MKYIKNQKNRAFTLSELIAVIVVLAVILLIAIPIIFGVIEDARRNAFRNSVLNIFGAILLDNNMNGNVTGSVSHLNMNNNHFVTGNWEYDDNKGDTIITQVCDGHYKASEVTDENKSSFLIEKDDGTCSFKIDINGNNPDVVSCHITDTYVDKGAKYGTLDVSTKDAVNLKYAGTYELHYHYQNVDAVRIVNVTNDNIPVLKLLVDKVIISSTNTTFDPMDYVTEATDLCEGDIKSYLNDSDLSNGKIVSNVILGTSGNYKVIYELVNKGKQKVSKTLEVEVKENELIINGNNPDTVNCHTTNKYIDQGAYYNFDTNIVVYADPLSLKNAGEYRLQYSYDLSGTPLTTTRTVNITNTNTPTITLTKESINIYKGDTFDPSTYLTSATDPCEGDITSKVITTSNVVTDVPGTYQVTYKVSNLGNIEGTKTLSVTVSDIPTPSIVLPTVDGSNGWYQTSQNITVNYNKEVLGSYEYAISTDGTTYGNYMNTASNSFSLNENSGTIYLKVRGKRGSKYTNIVTSNQIKMDTVSPTCTSSGGSSTWVTSRTITGTCGDGVSGCVNAVVNKIYTTSVESLTESPGVVKDQAGHQTVCPNNQVVYVDVDAPNITVSGNTDEWVQSVTLTVHATDAKSGLHDSAYSFDGGSTWQSSASKTVHQNTTVSIAVRDKLLNENSTREYVNRVDRTKPTGHIRLFGVMGKSGWYIGNISVHQDSVDHESGIKRAQLSTTSIFLDTRSQTITLDLEDNAGNTNRITEVVKLDKTPPVKGRITYNGSKGNNGWYKTMVSISSTGHSDAMSGVCSSSVSPVTSSNTSSSGNTVTLTVEDCAGNKTTYTEKVYVDSEKPTAGGINVSGSKGNGDWYTSSVNYYASGSRDLYSGIESEKFSPTSIYSDTSSSGTRVTLTVTDKAGNVTTKTTNIKVDRTKPTISYISPSAGSTLRLGGAYNFTCSGSDSASGIQSCTASPRSVYVSSTRSISVTYTATDRAGNKTTLTKYYSVR